jgi:hypothetical protein
MKKTLGCTDFWMTGFCSPAAAIRIDWMRCHWRCKPLVIWEGWTFDGLDEGFVDKHGSGK